MTYGDSYDGNRVDLEERNYIRSAPAVSAVSPDAEFFLSQPFNAWNLTKEQLSGVKTFSDLNTRTYIEAQLYGDITIDDVDCIYVEGKKNLKNLQKAIDKKGLDIVCKQSRFDQRLKCIEDPYGVKKGTVYASSLADSDVDALGDYYINCLCKNFAKPTPFRSWNASGEFESWYDSMATRIKSGEASMDEKREFLKKFYAELDKKEKGAFIEPWWSERKPRYGGWTSDVFEELLKRSK